MLFFMIHVILHVRMWIEIPIEYRISFTASVILHVRMWIEMPVTEDEAYRWFCHPPCEDVD